MTSTCVMYRTFGFNKYKCNHNTHGHNGIYSCANCSIYRCNNIVSVNGQSCDTCKMHYAHICGRCGNDFIDIDFDEYNKKGSYYNFYNDMIYGCEYRNSGMCCDCYGYTFRAGDLVNEYLNIL